MLIPNSKSSIWYGMHFYPGVAEYREPGKDAFRIFLNEDTIRSMGPTFAGRPVFVLHADEVASDIDELKKEADGWVIESFFNESDGKHWAKFLVCSKKAEEAIAKGYRLSNAYLPKAFGKGGEWNGVSYNKEVIAAEYEHLALVPNPRYEESIVMTPEQFKDYNDEKKIELKKLSNNKDNEMKFSFFKREKVKNEFDAEETMVVLPKSKREVSISTLVNEADEMEEKKKEQAMANGEDLVKIDDEKSMTVNELVEAYKNMCMKNEEEKEEEVEEEIENEESTEEDEEAKKKALELAEHEEKEIAEKKANAKKKADAIRNANKTAFVPETINFAPGQGVEIGKQRYGSK